MVAYAILDSAGRCINRVAWDGKTEWNPPEGCTAVPDPTGQYQLWQEPRPQPSIDLLAAIQSLTAEQQQALLELLGGQP